MKPPIVETFENKVKQEAISEYVKKDRKPLPFDSIFVMVMCIVAIIWAGGWAVPIVLFQLAMLSYFKTLEHKERMAQKDEPKVQDVE